MLKLILGDSLEILETLEPNSVDAVVTDPPYGLSFMNKKWDSNVPSMVLWQAVIRVLKPGGHLLSFGGTRTYHHLAIRIENAGFEIRDQLQWLFGSGFPKSMDVSKALDKAAGAEREIVGTMKAKLPTSNAKFATDDWSIAAGKMRDIPLTAPATDDAKQWQGWGTALKPANEPIVLARKPLSEKTVAANVLKWGCGAINIDASRIGSNPGYKYPNGPGGNSFSVAKEADGSRTTPVESTQGRWPANLLLDEEAAAALGEPSRFFYVAKASKSERNRGLEGMPLKVTGRFQANRKCKACGYQEVSGSPCKCVSPEWEKVAIQDAQNSHPTVKPIRLMEYLIHLVTPPGGVVLDPFMGSGSTGVAAKNLGFKFIGIELNAEYFEIARKRTGFQSALDKYGLEEG